jgi:Uma2 family endonuclease
MITKTELLTIADWDAMPVEDGYRYEVIEGELFVSEWPGFAHQVTLTNLAGLVGGFLIANRIGTGVLNPPLVLSNCSGVIPDFVFFSNEQRDTIVKDDRLTGPPAIVGEILSPGSSNIRRDRVVKPQLYGKHGVPEYWIVDLQNRAIERYINRDSSLMLEETLGDEGTLTTPALPGFSCRVSEIFSQF